MRAVSAATIMLLFFVADGNTQDNDIFEDEEVSVLEERCKYFGNDASYDNYVFATDEFKYCIQNVLNLGEIKKEMDEAKIAGDLDEVFMKYCKQKPLVLDCTRRWANETLDCLSDEERANVGFTVNVTAAAFDFACAHRGERIAYFLGEGGGECMNRSEIRKEMQDCNQFIDPFYKLNINRSIEASSAYYQRPYYRLNQTDCEKLEDFRGCMVAVLEKCSDPTPSNFADSLFRYVFKRTKCKKSSAAVLNSSVFTVLAFLTVSSLKFAYP